jgi:hypothetical protein
MHSFSYNAKSGFYPSSFLTEIGLFPFSFSIFLFQLSYDPIFSSEQI